MSDGGSQPFLLLWQNKTTSTRDPSSSIANSMSQLWPSSTKTLFPPLLLESQTNQDVQLFARKRKDWKVQMIDQNGSRESRKINRMILNQSRSYMLKISNITKPPNDRAAGLRSELELSLNRHFSQIHLFVGFVKSKVQMKSFLHFSSHHKSCGNGFQIC